jgi:hypothetical protein
MKNLLLTLLFITATLPVQQPAPQSATWRFDNLTKIGGVQPTVIGAPKVIATDIGKAVHFEGNNSAGDALFLDTLPLTGTLDYTLELIFRPSSKGQTEQRIFHLQEEGTQSRRMFEIRIHDDKWCVDTVAVNEVPGQPARSGIMLNCDPQHLFPLDRWYAIATTYDGKMLRTYVNGALQGEVAVALLPLGKGGTSIGTRYTKRDYFTGDMFSARFTRRALAPAELLKVPPN